MGTTTRTPAVPASIHQLKVTLAGIRPPIWRRLRVPSDVTLATLHGILQAAMGWEDSHLHRFRVGAATYGDRGLLGDVVDRGERVARLSQVAPSRGSKLAYDYDFGDGWEHALVVEAVRPPEPGVPSPVCVAGKRACPPEDCGGPWGYGELLAAIGNPLHPEHGARLAWLGGPFDPEAFDVADVNRRLAKHR
ncbi:MAG: plasmid pRiA4b ORF-3 family protein [Chloroflexota bacterium]|nr:plasmid pRiA4b ORF-3 family protein [Chloroflexota bacterium]